MKTYSARPRDVTRAWFVVDASDKVLGRLATQIAARLRGKHKAIYTPHIDTGDFIVVTNVDKIRVTGTKVDSKLYHRHSGYPGGITTTTFGQMQARFPGRALEKAVKGMLPKGPLGYAMIKTQVLRRLRASAFGATAANPRPLAHDQQLPLRHRTAKDLGRARVHEARRRQDRRQREARRRVLHA